MFGNDHDFESLPTHIANFAESFLKYCAEWLTCGNCERLRLEILETRWLLPTGAFSRRQVAAQGRDRKHSTPQRCGANLGRAAARRQQGLRLRIEVMFADYAAGHWETYSSQNLKPSTHHRLPTSRELIQSDSKRCLIGAD